MELQLPNQQPLGNGPTKMLPSEMRRVHCDKQPKHKSKASKLLPKEQLKFLPRHRIKQHHHLRRHTSRQEQENQNLPNTTVTARYDDLNRIHKDRFQSRQDHFVRQQLVSLDGIEQTANIVQPIPLVSPEMLEQAHIDEKEQVIVFQQPNVKLSPAMEQVSHAEILPQEVVLVSYNGDTVPSETGIVAYDENGQILLIHESDIKSVENAKAQHLLHTLDGTTYIIDNSIETQTVEPTYIVLDKSLAASNTYVIDGVNVESVVVAANEELATIVTEEEDMASTAYGFQNWDDFEIYQAMTAFRIAETSETHSVLAQAPIMSTVENPSSLELNYGDWRRKASAPIDTSQSLEDSLAKIGVIAAETSNIPPTLQLPSTVTDPTITSTILSVTNDEEDDDSNTIVHTSNDFWL